MAVNNSPYLIVPATSSNIDLEYDDDDDDDDALEFITETYNTCIDCHGYTAWRQITMHLTIFYLSITSSKESIARSDSRRFIGKVTYLSLIDIILVIAMNRAAVQSSCRPALRYMTG